MLAFSLFTRCNASQRRHDWMEPPGHSILRALWGSHERRKGRPNGRCGDTDATRPDPARRLGFRSKAGSEAPDALLLPRLASKRCRSGGRSMPRPAEGPEQRSVPARGRREGEDQGIASSPWSPLSYAPSPPVGGPTSGMRLLPADPTRYAGHARGRDQARGAQTTLGRALLSNRLGCVTSIVISVIGILVILALTSGKSLRAVLPRSPPCPA